MLGRPGGHLAFTLEQHIIALNEDKQNRFSVKELIEGHTTVDELSRAHVFWFYAKAFSPSVYTQLKDLFPHAKYVFGPNILLDKPDVGANDSWDEWFINTVDFDLHLDQVEFYNNHVKKFLRSEMVCKSTHLDKCMRLSIFDEDVIEQDRSIDCLVYSKKRRYDYNFEGFRNKIVAGLKSRNLNFYEITYGSYDKKDFLDLLLKSKVMLNLSLDECPGILNYEAMYCNTPVIGSPHNVPSTFDTQLWVENTDEMTEKYLVRQPEAAAVYLSKLDSFLTGEIETELSPREFVLQHTSYAYCS